MLVLFLVFRFESCAFEAPTRGSVLDVIKAYDIVFGSDSEGRSGGYKIVLQTFSSVLCGGADLLYL